MRASWRKARPAGRAFFFAILVGFAVAGCGSVTDVLLERDEIADRAARAGGLTKFFVETGQFELVGYRRFSRGAGDDVTVYFEGDGLAFLSANTVSRDPTPRDPVSLKLAARDPGANVAYLARPCQYQSDSRLARCSYAYWTNARFAPEVVRETNVAVDAIVAAAGASRVTLIGYSGGGVLAALVAAERDDVERLVTLAAPLDHATWTRIKRYSPLDRSLNPVDRQSDLVRVPQVHYLAEDDEIVPPRAVTAFAESVERVGGRVRVATVPGVDHWCCWPDRWPALLDAARR